MSHQHPPTVMVLFHRFQTVYISFLDFVFGLPGSLAEHRMQAVLAGSLPVPLFKCVASNILPLNVFVLCVCSFIKYFYSFPYIFI
jgi:hypothetical protein